MDKELLEAVFKAGYRMGKDEGRYLNPFFHNPKEAWLKVTYNKEDELNKPEFWNYV